MPDSAAAAPQPTPFMAQFLAAKAQHPDALVFFRMGDFYELFFEDAEKAAAALDLTLTRRGQHGGDPIPMAGVPWRQAEPYLARLVRQGFKVAIVEQMEDPAEARKRGSKAIVRREVVRVVTPGTLTEEALLDARARNVLAAVALDGAQAAIACADVSTGAFEVVAASRAGLGEALAALSPAEIVAAEADREAIPEGDWTVTVRPGPAMSAAHAARRLCAAFEVASLDGFGAFAATEVVAMAILVDYVALTQAGAAPMLAPPVRSGEGAHLAIDPATRASLELETTLRGAREGSLLHAVDRTLTAPGARLLAERLARPLLDRAELARRHDAVEALLASDLRVRLRAHLKGAPDLARALTRLRLGRGAPRDLAALRDGLVVARAVAGLLPEGFCAELAEARAALSPSAKVAALAEDLARALSDTLPAQVRDGGVFAAGFDAALDAARALRDDSRQVVAGLQAAYVEATGQPVKVRHNGVLGYHIEATARQAEALERDPRFIRRQATATSVRFTTAELAELDERIARAADDALAREAALFAAFAARADGLARAIEAAAGALARIDVAAANAEWACAVGAVRPEIDDSAALVLDRLRHPVVEAALSRENRPFTPNDVRLDGDAQVGPRLLLVTGPNMAGKSTYLRQTALAPILAQAGLFVPAARARIGLVDRVFSRVGAADDLARGRSTFMAEMVETAAILNQAGPRALVILDEIGRGTATFDGLAIAWATAEHLHDVNGCRAVFATHYHELTALPDRLAGAANASLRAREWKGDLVFLHEVQPGPADRSYGVAVAKLAGLPKRAVERAKAVLARLEAGRGRLAPVEALPLFAASGVAEGSALADALAAIDPDALTPREALEALYRLKRLGEG